ncbi:linear amide C-N hydrolase [Pseudoalteromonas rubra]|uniref:Choloylglycine hydrolase n=1 Tax=Pseudoalteromonas rubra TaxID=43658 RepID=A0A5S3X0Y3_9GAMM|nr:linear amide C-N hydrolase [Pseudoalteromonas rubra]TMP37586.1 choloylglycine hydrolase [Pseudoalteromonas rubra]
MCTRVFNNRQRDYLATARNMDWMYPLPTSFFAFDKGLGKTGLSEADGSTADALKWCSAYSSVVAMVGDDSSGWAASDGLNSMGLAANVLYDSGASYGQASVSERKKQLSVLRWVQYVLDNFVFVKDVVKAFNKQDILLVGAAVPNSDGKPAQLHLSVSDVTGNSAIIEVVDGVFVCYENTAYQVMTNEPSFDKQLKINDYWTWQWSNENTNPSHTIPGGAFSTDRFERATFYLNHMDEPTSVDDALAQARTVAANASVPLGYNFTVSDSPNISNTLWSTYVSHSELAYYFSNARTLNVIWFDLANADFREPVQKLDLIKVLSSGVIENHNYDGKINALMEATIDPYLILERGSDVALRITC